MTQEQMRNLNTIVETYGNDAQEDMVGSAGWNAVCRHDCYEYGYRIQD